MRPTGTAAMPAPLLMMAAMTLWVLVEIAGSVATRQIPIAELVWLRYVFHLLFMGVVLAPRFGLQYVRTRRLGLQLVRSVLMVIMPLSFMVGLRAMPAGEVFSVFWVAPLLVPVFAVPFGERPSGRTWALVLLAWAGTAVTYHLAARGLGWNVVPPLIMAGSFALYLVLTRVLDRTEGILTNLFYTALGVVVATTPLMPFVWEPPSLLALAGACAVGIIGWFALWTLDLSLRAAPASRCAPFLFFQVVVTEILRAVARHGLGQSQAIGLAMICVALVIAARSHFDR
jgi:drug/metabolite transporter (DMT)-like permease